MFFDLPKTKNGIIEVEDNFATLENIFKTSSESNGLRSQIAEGDMQFVFRYKISQLKAIAENAITLNITIRESGKDRPVIFSAEALADLTGNEIINNLLTFRNQINNINQDDANNFVVKKSSDISSKINNQLISTIKAGGSITDLGKKRKLSVRKIESNVKNDKSKEELVPQISHHSISDIPESRLREGLFNDGFNARSVYYKLLFEEGISPSDITKLQSRNLSTYEVFQGIVRKNKQPENQGDSLGNVLNHYLFQGQSEVRPKTYSTVLEGTIEDIVTVSTKINIKQSQIVRNTSLIAKFELFKSVPLSSGKNTLIPLETVEKSFDLQKQIDNFSLVEHPPIVSYTQKSGRVIFSIKQIDKKASRIKIYRKLIKNDGVLGTFSEIDTVIASQSKGPVKVEFYASGDDLAIYRFIPVTNYNEELSSEFTDVVVGKKSYKKKVILIPTLSLKGNVKIEVINHDPNITCARILYRDVTIKQKDFFHIQNLNFSPNSMASSISIKNRLIPNHIYEFTTMIVNASGHEEQSSHSAFLEYLQYEGGSINIKINEFLKDDFRFLARPTAAEVATARPAGSMMNGRTLDLRFIPSIELEQEQNSRFRDQIATFIGNYPDFSSSSINEKRSIFDKIICFQITRYNKTTGDVENLGIVGNNQQFTDSMQSSKFLARNLSAGNEYQYIITPLIRDPESIARSSQTQTEDVETKKKYSYDPTIKLYPEKLKRGTTFSRNFINGTGRDESIAGKIGYNYSFDVSYKTVFATIEKIFASFIDSKRISVACMINGDENSIDHILIFKEIENVRTLIGKSHCLTSNINFIHKITKHDIGEISYVLVPVYSDFSVGNAIYSNNLLIDLVE
jgi:hypothetical protein